MIDDDDEDSPFDCSATHQEALREVRSAMPMEWTFEPRPAPKAPTKRQRVAIRRGLVRERVEARAVPPTSPYTDPNVFDDTMTAERSLHVARFLHEAAEALTGVNDWECYPIIVHREPCASDSGPCTCQAVLTWIGARC